MDIFDWDGEEQRRNARLQRKTVEPEKEMKKPDRETIIGNDDFLNLRIALNTCNTIDEFIDNV